MPLESRNDVRDRPRLCVGHQQPAFLGVVDRLSRDESHVVPVRAPRYLSQLAGIRDFRDYTPNRGVDDLQSSVHVGIIDQRRGGERHHEPVGSRRPVEAGRVTLQVENPSLTESSFDLAAAGHPYSCKACVLFIGKGLEPVVAQSDPLFGLCVHGEVREPVAVGAERVGRDGRRMGKQVRRLPPRERDLVQHTGGVPLPARQIQYGLTVTAEREATDVHVAADKQSGLARFHVENIEMRPRGAVGVFERSARHGDRVRDVFAIPRSGHLGHRTDFRDPVWRENAGNL